VIAKIGPGGLGELGGRFGIGLEIAVFGEKVEAGAGFEMMMTEIEVGVGAAGVVGWWD